MSRNNTILRPYAIPVYSFLSFLDQKINNDELKKPLKILDCGAGGPIPPLSLFAEQGYNTWGIDISDEQLDRAKQYCMDHDLEINFQKADMCQIPFADNTFDCVYEHYSMCHLSKKDTAKAVEEIYRVLKHDGYAFLGIISMDCWPKSNYGNEKDPGEFWVEESSGSYRHSMFTDEEADQLVNRWKVISKEKQTRYLKKYADRISKEKWQKLFAESSKEYTENEWIQLYNNRLNKLVYSHIHFILKK